MYYKRIVFCVIILTILGTLSALAKTSQNSLLQCKVVVGDDKSVQVYDLMGNLITGTSGDKQQIKSRSSLKNFEMVDGDNLKRINNNLVDATGKHLVTSNTERITSDRIEYENSNIVENWKNNSTESGAYFTITEQQQIGNIIRTEEAQGLPNLQVYKGSGTTNTVSLDPVTNIITFVTSVGNLGDTGASGFRLGWYMSKNDQVITTDDCLIAYYNVTALLSYHYFIISIKIDLDAANCLEAGTYYPGVYVDDLNQVEETNENNNTDKFNYPVNYMPSLKPDISLYEGEGALNNFNFDELTHKLTVNFSLQNSGLTDADSFRVAWYFSLDENFSEDDYFLAADSLDNLLLGEYHVFSSLIDLDYKCEIPLGYYYLMVVFDDLNQINEINDVDNNVYFGSTIPHFGCENRSPNLTLYLADGANFMYYFMETAELVMYNTINNNGNADADSFRVAWYFSKDPNFDFNDYFLSASIVDGLAADSIKIVEEVIPLRDFDEIPDGDYYIKIVIDDLKEIVETTKDDNIFGYNDPYPFRYGANLKMYTGEDADNAVWYYKKSRAVNFSLSFMNDGIFTAENFNIKLFISSDTLLDNQDYTLCDNNVRVIYGTEIITLYSGAYMDSLSEKVPEGDYYVVAFIDEQNTVNEINENDNICYINQKFHWPGDSVNPPPVFTNTVPELKIKEGYSILYTAGNWYPSVEDANDPDSLLQFQVNPGRLVNSTQVYNNVFFFETLPDSFGVDSLQLSVSDGEFEDSTLLIFNILPINDPPVIINLPDTVQFVNNDSKILHMTDYQKDIDSDILTWSFQVNNEKLVWTLNTANDLTLTAHDFVGDATLICTLSDDSLASVSKSIFVRVTEQTDISENDNSLPVHFSLYQNYPNPFNPVTSINYDLPVNSLVKLAIYNLQGQLVEILVNETQKAGSYKKQWNASHYPSGVYICRIEAGNNVFSRKLILVK